MNGNTEIIDPDIIVICGQIKIIIISKSIEKKSPYLIIHKHAHSTSIHSSRSSLRSQSLFMKRQLQFFPRRGLGIQSREKSLKRANIIFFAVEKDNFEGGFFFFSLGSLPFGFGSGGGGGGRRGKGMSFLCWVILRECMVYKNYDILLIPLFFFYYFVPQTKTKFFEEMNGNTRVRGNNLTESFSIHLINNASLVYVIEKKENKRGERRERGEEDNLRVK